MKTLDQIFDFKGGDNCNFLDGRDKSRLLQFLPNSDWDKLGFKAPEGTASPEPEPFTLAAVMKNLGHDLDFAFEKALDHRGISSSLMFDVIKMWMWVLDDELADFSDYPMYGLPLYKAAALKYGFPNPIGDDTGSEDKYDSK